MMPLQHFFRPLRLALAGCAAALACGVAGLSAHAQDFPTKPIELNVLFPAGSSADVVARILADGMSRQLGQPVVIMNRPGAGGAIGYKHVHSQKPDGYSLVFNSNSISSVYYAGQVPFTYKAFEPVARVTVELPVLAVRAEAPWNNLKEMIEFGRKNPGAIRVGNSGLGSHTHISAVGFSQELGLDLTHVPFNGSQVITSLLGGHIEAVVQAPSALTAHVRAGTLKVLGAARLESALRATVNSAEFKLQGEKMGFLPSFQTADDFGRTMDADDVLMSKAMDKAGLKKQ
ncbi:MAG: tripartite tricarboxylate transporter substrate binding protein [Betaproteobacteria bacterium]|nr:tripartite tricarboxylate transporter substrate binding protein [Betaproteobacteria bacterium]